MEADPDIDLESGVGILPVRWGGFGMESELFAAAEIFNLIVTMVGDRHEFELEGGGCVTPVMIYAANRLALLRAKAYIYGGNRFPISFP